MSTFRPTSRLSGPRVLLCTADVGCGHGRAAHAVNLAIRSGWPGAQTKVVDALATTPAWFNHIYRDLYLAGAKHFPRFNGWLYNRTDLHGMDEDSGLGAMLESRAMRAFCNSEPVKEADIIVCTHFLCACFVGNARKGTTQGSSGGSHHGSTSPCRLACRPCRFISGRIRNSSSRNGSIRHCS